MRMGSLVNFFWNLLRDRTMIKVLVSVSITIAVSDGNSGTGSPTLEATAGRVPKIKGTVWF